MAKQKKLNAIDDIGKTLKFHNGPSIMITLIIKSVTLISLDTIGSILKKAKLKSANMKYYKYIKDTQGFGQAHTLVVKILSWLPSPYPLQWKRAQFLRKLFCTSSLT